MDSSSVETNLKIFTLNCWGLKYVSAHRQQRIKLIGQHLIDHNYDIVFLQEVWTQSDFEYINEQTKAKFSFAHMFKNASILGTSGLVVLVKWVPTVLHLHPFSVNGSPFQVLHGDWFTSKGIGYVRIELDALNLHLFCTHMHAQYNLKERLSDQYSVHRICQSYEMSKFIKLMTNSVSSHPNARDFIIIAGDMNASSKELPYRLLVSLLELKDCYKFRTKTTNGIGVEAGDCAAKELNSLDSDMSDDEYHTCGHRDNTFTPKSSAKGYGKRIDFILFRLFDRIKNSNESNTYCRVNGLCRAEHLTVQCKDESGLSFSDHQPVVAQFRIKCFDWSIGSKNNGSEGDCLSGNESNGYNPSVDAVNRRANGMNKNGFNRMSNGDGSNDREIMHESIGSGESGDGSECKQTESLCNENSAQLEKMGLLSSKPKLMSNVLSEVTETASKLAKSGPLQLKHMASNAIKSKVESIGSKRELLQKTNELLAEYVNENQMSFRFYSFVFILYFIILFTLSKLLLKFTEFSAIEVSLLSVIIALMTGFYTILKLLISRQEKNAIKAIINDIEKEILLSK